MQNMLNQAIQALNVDVPVLDWYVRGETITLLLYGGRTLSYTPEAESQPVEPPSTVKNTGRVQRNPSRSKRRTASTSASGAS